jgi:hypothetical protein
MLTAMHASEHEKYAGAYVSSDFNRKVAAMNSGLSHAKQILSNCVDELIKAGDLRGRLRMATAHLAAITPDEFAIFHKLDEQFDVIRQVLAEVSDDRKARLMSVVDRMSSREMARLSASLLEMERSIRSTPGARTDEGLRPDELNATNDD